MAERRLTGLALKVAPLGEHDRLLSLLSDAEGVSRFAVPGARRPKSSLAAAAPLTLLELQVCLLYTSPSPRDRTRSRMPSSA